MVVEGRPDDDDALVEIARLGSLEGELVVGRLRDGGIEAVVFESGMGGWHPAVGWAEGSRVMVRRRDETASRAVLRDPV